MTYNLDFLIASLVFLAFVGLHFNMGRRLDDTISARLFALFATIGGIDIILDILTSLMLTQPQVWSLWLLYPSLTLFYILQCTIPGLLLLHVYSLTGDLRRQEMPLLITSAIPAIIFAILCITNYWTGLFFHFDASTHVYTHGRFFIGMYAYALFYAILAVCYAAYKRNSMRRIDYIAIWEYLLIIVACAFVQYLNPHLMVTGFGIGLGLTILFFTLNNPFSALDPLTHVYESTAFKRKVYQLFETHQNFNVLFVSLDNMHSLNIIGGTDMGDQLLAQCAQSLLGISQTNQVYRLKGSCFAVIIDSRREQRRIVEEIQNYFSKKFTIKGAEFYISTRIACVQNAGQVESPDRLENYLEFLMDSLRNSEDQVVTKNINALDRFHRYQDICSYLPQAIEQDLFELYLQPIWSPEHKRFVTAEALTRLKHPQMGFIPPDEFFPIAEEEGLIRSISALQLSKLCRYIHANKAQLDALGIANIKYNLSPVEFVVSNLGGRIAAIAADNEIELSRLNFEITETFASQYEEEIRALAVLLQEHGSSIYMDDFGSGYANLSNVMTLPFEGIKIDRTITANILDDERAATMCHGLIKMMPTLNLNIVAEGVETEGQARILEKWGVSFLQGFLFSKPIPSERFIDFLKSQQEIE